MKSDKNILIGKYLSGNALPEEEKELLDWVKESPENEEEFERLTEFWKIAVSLKSTRPQDTEKAWEDFKSLKESEPKFIEEQDAPRFTLLKIAAVLALFVSSFVLIKYFTGGTGFADEKKQIVNAEPPEMVKHKNTELITLITYDSSKVFYLPDSSRVHLNKNSKLTYPATFGDLERTTELSGEAFFEIKHNSTPFIISCKQTKTRVMGTSFNVKGYEADKKVTVSVVTGTVQFSNNNNKSEVLVANESGVYDNQQVSLIKTTYTDKDVIWWKKIKLKTKIKKFIKKITHKN